MDFVFKVEWSMLRTKYFVDQPEFSVYLSNILDPSRTFSVILLVTRATFSRRSLTAFANLACSAISIGTNILDASPC